MSRLRVAIAGGSGYTGGELARLLLFHPHVELTQVASSSHAGQYMDSVHPNMRKLSLLRFCHPDEFMSCDVLFLCLPHGVSAREIERYRAIAPRVIDLSADFRLHSAGLIQELGWLSGRELHQPIAFSATAVELVRGVLITAHVFVNEAVDERTLWRLYREAYQHEPFIRLVKERNGVYRYPEPKILAGSNYCDIGFELDASQGRVVVIAALDNLMKGAAGNAVQALNCMCGWDENMGLTFPGLHPV